MNEQAKPFLRGYNVFRLPIIDERGESAWPSVFPPEKIDALRETVGLRHFSSQMMLEFSAEDKARLDPGALLFYDGEFDPRTARIADKERPPSQDDESSAPSPRVTGYSCYWDPSGGRARADASVCVIVYRDDKNRRAFIHDVRYLTAEDSDSHPMATQCEKVLDFMKLHEARFLAVEVNGLGAALPEILREIARRRGQAAAVQKIANHSRKELRILDAIEPLLTTGRLFAHNRIRATRLPDEMLNWTPTGNARHDDGLDALAGALRMNPAPIRPIGQTFKPIKAKTDFKI